MTAIDNLVHETTTTTGTGNMTLVATGEGKQSFNSAFGVAATLNVFYYYISSRDAAEYEYGTGHLGAATVLVRDTVLGGTNGTSKVNFSAGTKDVWNDLPAENQNNPSTTFDNTTTSIANTTTETNALSHTVPANALGANGFVKLVARGYYYNSSGAGDTITLKIKFGATTLWADISASISTGAQKRPFDLYLHLYNTGTTGSQRMNGHATISSNGAASTGFGDFATDEVNANNPVRGQDTISEDTTSDKDLVVTAQHTTANANIQFVCEMFEVTTFKAA